MCKKPCLDNCGVAAICRDGNAVAMIGQCLFHLQNRGQRYVGVSSNDRDEINGDVAPGLVKSNQRLFRSHQGGSAIGHVSLKEPQPFTAYARSGKISLAFSGDIINARELRQEAMQSGQPFTSENQAELLIWLICQSGDPVEGLKKMAERVIGSYSLVLLTQTGLFAVRDPYGFKPLVIGRGRNGCAVTSESPAITETGLDVVRDVIPGEIVLLEKQGFTTVGQIPGPRCAFCAFEWAYTARFDSVLETVPVELARHNMGEILAQRDNVEADLVAPIPMSGIGHALGYHKVSRLPYGEVFFYNRYSSRSYAPLEQTERDSIAAEKLSLITRAIRGQRIVLCDDSIVRGTQMGKQVLRLRAAGAKEIHLRVASPPLIAPCRYGISTRSSDELIARKHKVDDIRKLLAADTLKFNNLDDFVAAIGLPKEQLCLACFTGEYPL